MRLLDLGFACLVLFCEGFSLFAFSFIAWHKATSWEETLRFQQHGIFQQQQKGPFNYFQIAWPVEAARRGDVPGGFSSAALTPPHRPGSQLRAGSALSHLGSFAYGPWQEGRSCYLDGCIQIKTSASCCFIDKVAPLEAARSRPPPALLSRAYIHPSRCLPLPPPHAHPAETTGNTG